MNLNIPQFSQTPCFYWRKPNSIKQLNHTSNFPLPHSLSAASQGPTRKTKDSTRCLKLKDVVQGMVAQVLELEEGALLDPRGQARDGKWDQEGDSATTKEATYSWDGWGDTRSRPLWRAGVTGVSPPVTQRRRVPRTPSALTYQPILLLSLPRQFGVTKPMSDCPDFSPDINKFTFWCKYFTAAKKSLVKLLFLSFAM